MLHFLNWKELPVEYLLKRLVLHVSVLIYAIWYCVQKIKQKTLMCELKYMIMLEKGIVRTRNHLLLILNKSFDLCLEDFKG